MKRSFQLGLLTFSLLYSENINHNSYYESSERPLFYHVQGPMHTHMEKRYRSFFYIRVKIKHWHVSAQVNIPFFKKEVNDDGLWSFIEVELIPCLRNCVDSHFPYLSTTK